MKSVKFVYSPYATCRKPCITFGGPQGPIRIEGHAAFDIHTKIMQVPQEERQAIISKIYESLAGAERK